MPEYINKYSKMKTVLAFSSLLFILGCASNKIPSNSRHKRNIYYVFPDKIISLFEDKINDSSYFCLSSDSCYYDLYISSGHDKYASLSNRKIFIHGKFYPLIFDYDMFLGTTTSQEEILKQYSAGEYLVTTTHVEIFEGFFVKFRKVSNQIVESGYALALMGEPK
jgi:hypothetical protein